MKDIQWLEIKDGERVVALVGYETSSRTLRLKNLAPGRRTVRVWSPSNKQFRVAGLRDEENVVDVKWNTPTDAASR